MKRIYSTKTKTGLKSFIVGLFLLGTFFAEAQCTALYNHSNGPNGSVSFISVSMGTTASSSYTWNFAGTGTATGNAPTHVFPTNGTYAVCLTMNSNTTIPNSCINTTCMTVVVTNATPSVTPCNANFSYTLGANGLVNFASTSTGTISGTIYSWTFGNTGTASGITASNTYTSNGYKPICLTITNSVVAFCTNTKCDSVLITNAPTPTVTPCNANFTSVLGANGSVNFASTSTGTSVSTNYSWNFSGSATGTGITPTHTYTSNGPKLVCLTITNSVTNCINTKCDTVFITNIGGSVTPCAPSVVYTLTKDTTQALTWYSFPSYPSNITNATWYWGDGSTTTGLYPTHTYSAAGTYSTCVTVSVSCGTITATYCYVAGIFRSSESNDMITVNIRQAVPTGIQNQTKAEDLINIYPNPSNGEFVLELTASAKELKGNTVLIYNIMGEKVFEQQLLTNSKQTIDVSNLANGTYLINVSSESGSFHKKIIIQK